MEMEKLVLKNLLLYARHKNTRETGRPKEASL